MSETPLYDELKAKWNAVGEDSRICDEYTRCFYIETGAEWFEDIEGNEVFPEPTYAYLAPQDVKVGDAVTPIKLGEPQYAEGGVVKGSSPEVQRLLENSDNDCPVALVPKRKFKLFGRSQDSQGVL